MIGYFKLSSGEELVGEIVETTDESFQLKNCLLLHPVQLETGQVSMQMVPFPIISDETQIVTLMKTGIVAISDPSKDFIQTYKEKFGIPGFEVVSASYDNLLKG